MNFNKYIVAIGVALSFFVASLKAQECPVNMNKIDAKCQKLVADFGKLTEEEQADESENSKVTRLRQEFEKNCTESRAGIWPNCPKLTPENCILESKCKMSGGKCAHRTGAELEKLMAGECKTHEGEQGAYCTKFNRTESFGSCLCSKRGTGCIFDCSKMTTEAACGTEPTACSWNGGECVRQQ